MFEIGSMVTYSTEGVCKIIDIQKMDFMGSRDKEYYILEPIAQKGAKLYVPVDNEALVSKIKNILTYDEIIELITTHNNEIEWIEDNRQRSKYHKDIFSSNDKVMIISLAKRLLKIKLGKMPAVKKLYASDEEILKRIGSLLYNEFACVMNISEEQVFPFILGEILPEKL